MNVFYEEDGAFKVGSILADNTTSLQVESMHGKRSKIKAANVLLRFAQPGLIEFMTQAEGIAADIDVEFLWECSPPDDFGFNELASEYFGHAPNPIEAAGTLIRLHSSPMHFYKKGKGHYKAAPPDALKSALASAEKKRLQAALQARYTNELIAFTLPPEFTDKLPHLLYKPDRNTLEVKALEAACTATHLSAAHLLQRCGAVPSTQAYHLQRFLFENFPHGTGFAEVDLAVWSDLPLAVDTAFSIDDATTTEIDDAFSVRELANGNWRIGVHIAAPSLGIAPGSPGDEIAMQRMSTVYMPGDKITMLPDNVVQAFTLSADKVCPSLSMYLEVDADTLAVLGTESRIERIHIAANLRHDTLEPLFNEDTLAAGKQDFLFAAELTLLWKLAQKLEATRGKSADNSIQQVDYNFHVENDRISISTRQRGSPIDKVVAELMIFVNSEWGKLLATHDVAGIYRTQSNGKVKMSTVPAPHQGLGVAQYMWSSSPLRRYIDFINQRQIISLLREDPPAYTKNDTTLFAVIRDFDAAYMVYNEFQRNMERYWCLRWLLQENIQQAEALVLRENLVKLVHIPLISRIPSLPELPPNTRVILEIGEIDLLDLNFNARFISTVEEEATAC
ncbi:ribonuclease catalytic domain-containing protein [Candidatus Nitrotoga sp. 1052]|uniref:ribonuclease catalytic domain-containing protein n=1 Tax=Candidatus Nitrotoga sp. 1052 TaxID=2886964 RepID=UPI001EF69CA3|nr:RNB domain-containing ribonuclease [Candidatus Nitrotoga sp. 1052]CAH1071988.1 Exoribonuclease II [Candidatus Nitrotoga sp. 1052]